MTLSHDTKKTGKTCGQVAVSWTIMPHLLILCDQREIILIQRLGFNIKWDVIKWDVFDYFNNNKVKLMSSSEF